MLSCSPLSLRARYVFPMLGPPIAGGIVTLVGQRIVSVGRHAEGRVRDLGDMALVPGLLNAHTHLELSDAPHPLGRPGIAFAQWLEEVIRFRTARDQAAPGAAVKKGLSECRQYGTAAMGDIVQPDWTPQLVENAGVYVTAFLELIAPTESRAAALGQRPLDHLHRGEGGHWRPGLCPHAPYTVVGSLRRQAIAWAAAYRVPLAFHLAESREEIELLCRGAGALCEFLEARGVPSRQFAGGLRPLDFLRELAQAPRTLVIHGNYLDEEEIAFLAERRSTMAVVYCPRTHAWFQHETYPLARMLSAGVRVVLGTDSRASAPDLNMLAEVQHVVAHHPGVSPGRALELATVEAARALGLEEAFGVLAAGRPAALAAIRLPQRQASDPYELLLEGTPGPVDQPEDTYP